MLAGLDEAGRGSVLGPLVIAGVLVDRSALRHLKRMGVKDSKLLSRVKRNALFSQIKNIVEDYSIVVIKPSSIDRYVRRGKLNILEAKFMNTIIKRLEPTTAFVDACSDPSHFRGLMKGMTHYNCRINAINHGERHVAVAAASVLAKVKRDSEIEKIRMEHGDIGSGYPSDEKTLEYLSKWINAYRKVPNFARSSWKPVRKMVNGYMQMKSQDFK